MKTTKRLIFCMVAVAAAILMIRSIGIPSVPIGGTGDSSSSLAPLEEQDIPRVPIDIPIWYVNKAKNGLEKVTFTQDSLTPAYLFETWRKYNKLPSTVVMKEFIKTDNSETTEQKEDSNSTVVSHKTATELYITIDLSSEFAEALKENSSALLVRSLEQTFKDNYSYAKLFLTITIEGKPLPL